MQQFQQWDQAMPPIQFSTSLLPVKRGIFMTLYAYQRRDFARGHLSSTYQDHPFVRVQPLAKLPELRQVTGTNFCDIGICFNPLTQVLTVVAVIDICKGCCWPSDQNFNRWAKIPRNDWSYAHRYIHKIANRRVRILVSASGQSAKRWQ